MTVRRHVSEYESEWRHKALAELSACTTSSFVVLVFVCASLAAQVLQLEAKKVDEATWELTCRPQLGVSEADLISTVALGRQTCLCPLVMRLAKPSWSLQRVHMLDVRCYPPRCAYTRRSDVIRLYALGTTNNDSAVRIIYIYIYIYIWLEPPQRVTICRRF